MDNYMKKREIRALSWGALNGALVASTVAVIWSQQTAMKIGVTLIEAHLRRLEWDSLTLSSLDRTGFSVSILIPVLLFLVPIGTAAGAALLWLYTVLRTDWRQHAWLEIFVVSPALFAACTIILWNSLPHVQPQFVAFLWKSDVESRQSMMPDLQAHHKLKGMTRAAVIQLLGEPDETRLTGYKDERLGVMQYSLENNQSLRLYFDKKTNVVVDYKQF